MRIILHLLLAALLAVVIIVLVVLIALATPPGKALLAGYIERTASQNGLTLSIDGLTGWPPFSIGADRITLADPDGVFAEIDNAAISPRLLPLITGNLDFASIAADRIAVARQPNLPGGGGEGALLPFAAEQVSVARLELGAALAGRPAVLSLTGSYIGGRDGSLAASVDAERIDGVTGTLTARASRADARAPLALDLNLTEADDGILVGLMGRDTGPGYTLAAHTGFDGNAFDGDVSLTSDGRAHFDGRFTLTPDGDGHRLVLSGAGDLAELVPPEYGALLSGQIDVAVDATWMTVQGDPLPQIAIRQGTVATAAVRATASGSLTTAAANLDLSLDVTPPAGVTIPVPGAPSGTRVGAVSLTGTVRPSGEAVRLEMTGRAAAVESGDLSVPNLGLSLAVEADQSDPLATTALPYALRLEADAVETPSGRVAATTGAPLILSAEGTYDTETRSADTNADLTAAGATITFAGTVSAAGANGRAETTIDDLSRFSPFAGRPLSGGVRAMADGRFGAESDFALSATGVNIDPGDATLRRLLAGTAEISGRVQLAENGSASVTNLSVTAPAVQATANGSIARDAIDLTLDGSIADLAALADASSGAANFTARVSGAPSRPDVDATVRVASGRLLDQPIEEALVRFAGAPDDTGWQGALTLSGSFAGTPLTGTATATLDRTDNLLSLPAVDLTIGGNRITGAVTRTAAGPLSGSLTVDAPDLNTLAAFALMQATGSGRADLTFTPDGARQTIAANFDASNVATNGFAASRVTGTATIGDAFGAPQVSGNATANGVNAGGLALTTLQANATVTGGATQFQAAARGPDINLTGRGALSGGAGAQVIRLDALDGTAFRFPVALSQPLTIDLAGGRLSGATLALGGGTLRLDGTVTPTLNLTVTANRVAASVINTFAPELGAEGTITGRATITGTGAAPQIAWQADWTGLRVAATRNAGLPGLQLSARGNATRTSTSLTANLSGAGLSLAIDGTAPFAGSGLNIRAQGTAPLSLLALEQSREVRLGGTARVNLTVTGSTAAPAIGGTVDVVDGVFADPDSGFGIVGANGRINFDGQRATIQNLTARMNQGGDVAVAGTINTSAAGLPADLTVRITNGRYSDGEIVNTTFSANLAVTGPLTGAGLISGNVALGRTEIRLPERIGGAAAAIQVTHINTPPGFVAPLPRHSPRGPGRTGSAPAPGGGGGLRLDVTMTGPSGIYVRGFGIDAELGGTLRLAGTVGNPQTIGGFQMIRGRMEVIGRRFNFTHGELTFEGSLVPRVDFSATTTTADATVTLTVIGPANAPDIAFTSVPDLPEEEIVARLLFNQSVGRLSPLQAVQLVDAIAQLTGAVGGGGILARIRAATGLDDLDIRQSATGGTTVGIGARLGERVRLGVEGGTDPNSGRVVIDLDITRDLKAKVEAAQDGNSRVGLSYEYEY